MAKFSCFEAGKPAVPPAHSYWPRNHEQVALDAPAASDRHAIIVRFRPIWIIGAVVDRIHQSSLGWRIAGRHGEIGVTTKVSEQLDFIVEATPAAIRPRI